MHELKHFSGILIIALFMSMSAHAAEWSVEPKISLRTGYNDNIRLTTLDHDSVWEAALSPSVRFGVAKENQGLVGDAGFKIRRFTGGNGRDSSDVLDREDYNFNTNAYHGTERNTFRGNINYTRDSTQDSQLDQSGNVVEYATRDRFTLGPSWERILTEKMKASLEYQFTTISYSDDINLVEYDYHVLSSSLVRQFTTRVQGTLSASYSLYKPESDIDSRTISLQAGISRNFSETLVASFLVGQRQTTSDTFVPLGFCFGAGTFPNCPGGGVVTGSETDETDNNGLIYAASISKTLETGSLSASLTRSSDPSGDGDLLDSTRLRLSGEHRFT
ncbi:MAG: hypothetical protein WBN57_12360, partial [Gammaproteobacteria bacterium]